VTSAQKRLKYVATINDEALGEDTDADFEMQYVDISNVDSSGTIGDLVTYRFEDAPSRARRRVRDGDVIISTVRTYLQAIAQIRQPPANLVVSTGFAVVRPGAEVFDAQYCKYALREPEFLAEVERRSVGVSYPAINASDLASIPVHIHEVNRQRAIADYLDRETARLDALVAAKVRVVGLLAEKRRALMTRAVTRGLDPRAPLRDSGIPWLGEIPAHWIGTRLKFVADVRGGITIGQRYSPTDLIEVPYLRVANVQDGRLDLTEVATVLVPSDEATACMLEAGDVLMNEGGDADKLGRGCVWRGEIVRCLHQNHVFAVRPRRVLSDWLNIWTSTDGAKAFFESRAKQSTNLASISATNINELPIPLPPPEEQGAIIEQVNDASAKLGELCVATERTIALLKERRAALIAAVVTGQIEATGTIASTGGSHGTR
jgi:type I restriction enzyme S subunit